MTIVILSILLILSLLLNVIVIWAAKTSLKKVIKKTADVSTNLIIKMGQMETRNRLYRLQIEQYEVLVKELKKKTSSIISENNHQKEEL